MNPDGTFRAERVLVRRSPQAASLSDLRLQLERDEFLGATTEISSVTPDEVQLMDVSPKQIVSVAAALIPFLEHDDANRALMGANMQRQAVPLLRAEAPYIGTGIESRAARDAADMVLAEEDGVVVEVDGSQDRRRLQEVREAHLQAPQVRALQPGHLHQPAPASCAGEKVKAGDVLAEGPSTDNGELALGKNLLVAFMPWEGYNFEDAIILNERLVRDDVLTSIHIKEHEVDARDTKLGPEEITRDIPNLSEEILADLDERGIIRVGAEVNPGDVLVGKVTPKGETELTPEERLLRAIFGEKAREVRDTSLKVPHGETGKVIDVKVFSRDDDHELPPGRQPAGAGLRRPEAQDLGGRQARRPPRQQGRHRRGSWPSEDMPFMADGTPVDIILNPLGVPSRMNVGQVLETHLGYAARWGWTDGDRRSARTRSAAPRPRPGPPPSRRRSSPRRCSTAPSGTRPRWRASTPPSRRSSRTSTPRPPTASA